MGRILVVDPGLLCRKRMRSILEAAGHTVTEMVSPAEVIKELNSPAGADVHLILTELVFPDSSGLSLLRWLKSIGLLEKISVLVVTEQPPRETVIEMVAEGAATIVAKPFGADLLLRRVTETLAQQRALHEGDDEILSWHIGEYLRRELKRAERTGSPFSVVVCRVPDLLDGRAVPALMGGLARIMRESDVLARLGRESVVILLPDTNQAGAAVVTERIQTVAKALGEESGNTLALRIRVLTGTATFPTEAAEGDGLIALARERSLG